LAATIKSWSLDIYFSIILIRNPLQREASGQGPIPQPLRIIDLCEANAKQIDFVLLLLLFYSHPVSAASCTAKIKTGRSPYAAAPENVRLNFLAYWVGTLGTYPQYGIMKSFVGDRFLMVPANDLYEISPGCVQLRQHIGD
jgi:hypothetical protein